MAEALLSTIKKQTNPVNNLVVKQDAVVNPAVATTQLNERPLNNITTNTNYAADLARQQANAPIKQQLAQAMETPVAPEAQAQKDAIVQGLKSQIQPVPNIGTLTASPRVATLVQPNTTPSATNPMVVISPRGANAPTSNFTPTSKSNGVSQFAPTSIGNMPTKSLQPLATPNQGFQGMSANIYNQLTPDQQAQYQQQAYQEQAGKQTDLFSKMYGQQEGIMDDRLAGIKAEIEAAKIAKDPLLDEQTKQQIDALELDKQRALETLARNQGVQDENIKQNLSFSGFGRSTKAADLLNQSAQDVAANKAQIESSYAGAEGQVRSALVEKQNKELERLQSRYDNTQDSADNLRLQKVKDGYSLIQDLFKQDPNNPENMIKTAEKLQATDLAKQKLAQDELKAVRDDARQNFQFMITNFGSDYVNNLPPDAQANLAGNLGIPASVLGNMGRTLAEQKNDWEQLKYVQDRQYDIAKTYNDQAFRERLSDKDYQRDLQKIGINYNNDISKLGIAEQFKSDADARKYANLGYGNYANQASGIVGNGAGLILDNGSQVNPQLKNIAPPGSKKSPGANGYGGQCAYEAEKCTTLNGKAWSIGNTLQEKKNNLAGKVKKGEAFYPGQGQPVVGNTIISNDSPTYGHVSVINEIKPDGSMVLSEYNRLGALSFSNSRTIPANDKSIIGFLKTEPSNTYKVSKNIEGLAKDVANRDPLTKVAAGALQGTLLGKLFGAIPRAIGKGEIENQGMQNQQTGEMENQMKQGLIDEQGQQITPDRQAVRAGIELPTSVVSEMYQRNPQAYTQYATDLAYSKQNGKGKDLPVAAKDAIGKVNAALDNLNSMQNKLKLGGEGNAPRITGDNFGFSGSTPYEVDQRLLVENVGRLQSGGAISKEELTTFNNMMPSYWDSPEVKDYKLSQAKNFLNAKLTAYGAGNVMDDQTSSYSLPDSGGYTLPD